VVPLSLCPLSMPFPFPCFPAGRSRDGGTLARDLQAFLILWLQGNFNF